MTRLERASLWEIERLVRCFTLYFHLANTAEQHHRISAESIAPQHATETVVRSAIEDGMTLEELRHFYEMLHIRPVFTAHPTEAARRSILSKLQAIDDTLTEWQS